MPDGPEGYCKVAACLKGEHRSGTASRESKIVIHPRESS